MDITREFLMLFLLRKKTTKWLRLVTVHKPSSPGCGKQIGRNTSILKGWKCSCIAHRWVQSIQASCTLLMQRLTVRKFYGNLSYACWSQFITTVGLQFLLNGYIIYKLLKKLLTGYTSIPHSRKLAFELRSKSFILLSWWFSSTIATMQYCYST